MPASPPAPVVPAKAPQCPPDPETPPELRVVDVEFLGHDEPLAVKAEYAASREEKRRGLMYRTALGQDAGMLFAWRTEQPRSFWMKNTCIALDMLFIDAEGVIVNILEQVPTLNTAPRRSGCPAQYVLEVNAGWTRAHGVMPGQRVRFDI